jgi:DUF971 family protein
MTTNAPAVTNIHYSRGRRELELTFADNTSAVLSAEFLRVHSPSAEVKGHGPGQESLQVGKLNVAIEAIQPVGHYAIQLVFDDGHDSGIFTWGYLHELAQHQAPLWQRYLAAVEAAGASRDPDEQVLHFQP